MGVQTAGMRRCGCGGCRCRGAVRRGASSWVVGGGLWADVCTGAMRWRCVEEWRGTKATGQDKHWATGPRWNGRCHRAIFGPTPLETTGGALPGPKHALHLSQQTLPPAVPRQRFALHSRCLASAHSALSVCRCCSLLQRRPRQHCRGHCSRGTDSGRMRAIQSLSLLQLLVIIGSSIQGTDYAVLIRWPRLLA